MSRRSRSSRRRWPLPVLADPVGDVDDRLGLPALGLWVEVLRIVVNGDAVLGALDLDQPGHGRDPPDVLPGGLDRDERVAGAVEDQDRAFSSGSPRPAAARTAR